MKTNKPKVSIVIRTRNESRFIKKCLTKIFSQTEKNFEVIVVDNTSTDDTLKIIKNNFKSKKIKILKYPYKIYKPGKALNFGSLHAKGHYLCYLSAHCIPKNRNWLKYLLNSLKIKNVCGAYGKQEATPETNIFEAKALIYTFGLDKIIQSKNPFFHNANSIIKKKFWDKKNFNEKTDHIEDIIWGSYWIKKGFKLAYEPLSSVDHYHGMCHHNKSPKVKKILKIIKALKHSS